MDPLVGALSVSQDPPEGIVAASELQFSGELPVLVIVIVWLAGLVPACTAEKLKGPDTPIPGAVTMKLTLTTFAVATPLVSLTVTVPLYVPAVSTPTAAFTVSVAVAPTASVPLVGAFSVSQAPPVEVAAKELQFKGAEPVFVIVIA